MTPRISILIPNFNNGKTSSRSGQDDLIGDLMLSLERTLKDDPTPLEIIAFDDGSTDDSLATLRDWSTRTWRDGQPFLKLLEGEHCGYLSRIANILCREARGDIFVRLDGDIVCLTRNWASIVAKTFDEGDDQLGIIGPKQLRVDGRIHAFGDFVLHPNGYSHVASGLPRDAVQHELEVDHIMGCFYCHKREVWQQIGGYDERLLRGQTEDVSLRARLKGWRCVAVPTFEFVHRHVLRLSRPNEADTPQGIDRSVRIFERKWGFNRLAPDLDEVRRQYAGTPLLWNAHVFSRDKSQAATPLTLATSGWTRYANDEAFRESVNLRVGTGLSAAKNLPDSEVGRTVLLGAGDGLVPHLMALLGTTTFSLDSRADHIAMARQMTNTQTYPVEAPTFELMDSAGRIPLRDGSAGLIVICDMLETHHNPVGLLREAQRVLIPNGLMAIISQRKSLSTQDPTDPATESELATEHRFLWLELLNVVQSMRAWEFLMDVKSDDVRRDMAMLVRRMPHAELPERIAPEMLTAAG